MVLNPGGTLESPEEIFIFLTASTQTHEIRMWGLRKNVGTLSRCCVYCSLFDCFLWKKNKNEPTFMEKLLITLDAENFTCGT